jgi:hypothetical protein
VLPVPAVALLADDQSYRWVKDQLQFLSSILASMLRRLRETGPVLLVPAAWLFAGLAHIGVLDSQPVLIGHMVMTALLAGFLLLSWDEMSGGVLRVWRTVILLGVPITLAGVIGLLVRPKATVLLTVALGGWMVLPALALARTAPMLPHDVSGLIATVGGGLSLLGALLYAGGWFLSLPELMLLALATVGVGQTLGIADAVYRF